MKAVVTRVSSASVEIGGRVEGAIDKGFLVLLGVKDGDTEQEAVKLADKVTKLRVFEDGDGKMNMSLAQMGGKLLVISQFTLLANPMEKGNRPSFIKAARPETAIPLYELFISRCRDNGFEVATGRFGADMKVASVNDGPVTLIFDTDK